MEPQGQKWRDEGTSLTDRALHCCVKEDARLSGRSELPSPTPTEQLLREIAGVKEASWAQSQEWVRLMASSAAAAEARTKILESELAAMASEVAAAKGCIADLEHTIKEQDQAVASAAGKVAALEDRVQAAEQRAELKSKQVAELREGLREAVAHYEEANERAHLLAQQLKLQMEEEQADVAAPRLAAAAGPLPPLSDTTEMTPLGANARWAAQQRAANPASLSLPSPKVRNEGPSSLDASLCNLSSPAAISPAMGPTRWAVAAKPHVLSNSDQENQSPQEAAWKAEAGSSAHSEAWPDTSAGSTPSSAVSSPGEESLSGSIERVEIRPMVGRGSRQEAIHQRRGHLPQRSSLQMSQGPLGKAASKISSPKLASPGSHPRKQPVPWVNSVKPVPKNEPAQAGAFKRDRRAVMATAAAKEQPSKQAQVAAVTPGKNARPALGSGKAQAKPEPLWASPKNGAKAAGYVKGFQFLLANEAPCSIPPTRPRSAATASPAVRSPGAAVRQPLSPANSNQPKPPDTRTSPLSKHAARPKSARGCLPGTHGTAVPEEGTGGKPDLPPPLLQHGIGTVRNKEQVSRQHQALLPNGSAKKLIPKARSPTQDFRDEPSACQLLPQQQGQQSPQHSPFKPPAGQVPTAKEAAKTELQGQGWVHDLYGSSDDPYTPEKVSAVQKGLLKLANMVSPRLAGQGGSPYLSPRTKGLQTLMGGGRGARVKSALVHQFGDTE